MKRSASVRQPTGFTLVELLVVIAIIGILTAILVPTLAVAIRRTREATIRFELKQLEMAMEEYKMQSGLSYPPDFTLGPGADATAQLNSLKARVNAHLKKISSNNKVNIDQFFTDISVDPSATDSPPKITPDEALVFWLGGTRKNKLFPVEYPMPNDDNYRRFFDFDEGRLVDFDNDGFPSYVPRYGPPVPYVYFDSRTYQIASYDPSSHSVSKGKGIALAYARSATQWSAEDKFQILSAGYDGDYGASRDYSNSANWKQYPTTNAGSLGNLGDRDNFASFADSRLDKELD